ncbi:MAG TPA: HEAT repeat domain-containing protein [Tepidisphaeraceae bacterium]|nr:HEAT repeat domain-containing protein [Tepidisphaeraceae bacterium]
MKLAKTRLLALALLASLSFNTRAADVVVNGGPPPKEADLIKLISAADAAKGDKGIACKQLAVWGTKQSVPALAALLPDPELNSWARIALEAITDPAADDALRAAVGTLKDRPLVGVINSIAVRRDVKAVPALAEKLADTNEEVAAAAAVALGHIGGPDAAGPLTQRLTTGPAAVRSAAAEGAVLVAERWLAEGKAADAVKLYDAVRAAPEMPKQRVLEATRGAILARGPAGAPLLVEQLRSPDREIFRIAMRTARELQGPEVADAIIGELARTTPDRQSLLILALADRPTDKAKVLPVVTEAAKSGAPGVRTTAAETLEFLGNISSVPVLIEAASGADAALAQAAITSLARMPGKDIDADLLARLKAATGKPRRVLIELAEQRKLEGSMAEFVKAIEDPEPTVKAAALEAIGANGDDKLVPDLLRLMTKAPETERDAIAKAVRSISGRWGAAVVPLLLPVAKTGEPQLRIAALGALAGAGGKEALDTVVASANDADETLADEAVRTLSTWPNRWPEDTAVLDPLMNLAKTGKKPAHKVLATRGYLQFATGTKKMPEADRLKRINEVLPLITRPEERRQAIAALAAVGSAAALDALVAQLNADASVADEAANAIVTVASKGNRGIPAPKRKAALQAAADKATSPAIKAKATETLKGVK